jgi:hypothetical protein
MNVFAVVVNKDFSGVIEFTLFHKVRDAELYMKEVAMLTYAIATDWKQDRVNPFWYENGKYSVSIEAVRVL